jgi:hypothetical protein
MIQCQSAIVSACRVCQRRAEPRDPLPRWLCLVCRVQYRQRPGACFLGVEAVCERGLAGTSFAAQQHGQPPGARLVKPGEQALGRRRSRRRRGHGRRGGTRGQDHDRGAPAGAPGQRPAARGDRLVRAEAQPRRAFPLLIRSPGFTGPLPQRLVIRRVEQGQGGGVGDEDLFAQRHDRLRGPLRRPYDLIQQRLLGGRALRPHPFGD